MRTPRPLAVAALAALFAVAGCSDSPVGPDHGPVDLDTALGEMSLATVIPGGVGLTPVSSAALVPHNCAYNASAQAFACAPVVAEGLTMTQDYALLTSAGAPQSAFDVSTTDAIRQHMTIRGSIVASGTTMNVDVAQTMTLSGLLSGTHVLNGQQVTHLVTTGTYAMTDDITTTIAGLVLPAAGGRYPKAGSVTMVMSDASYGQPASSLTLTMVFNGTSKVDVTFTADGKTTHCTLDLESNAGAGACG